MRQAGSRPTDHSVDGDLGKCDYNTCGNRFEELSKVVITLQPGTSLDMRYFLQLHAVSVALY